MKVLHLVKTSVGASWALRQMTELVKLGVEIHVALPTDGSLISKYIENGIIVHELNWSLKGIVNTSKRLRGIIKELAPDIIHSHFVLTTLIMRIALRDNKAPRIFQVPGPLHLENWIFRNLEIVLAQKNDYWVGSCKWTNDRYRKSGIKDDHIFLSYYGSDLHKTDCYLKDKLRKSLGLCKNDILIGIVAYMYEPKYFLGQKRGLKGHEDLIDAVTLLSKRYSNLYCVCIGGAWAGATKYEKKIKKYAQLKASGKIFFTGTISNIGEVYNDLFCVIHPSHSENLGGAAESLLLGVPTISSNVGGFTDIVINGETGLTIPPKNPKAIAEAIESLIIGHYDMVAMSKRGKELTSEILDITNTSNTIHKIYRRILNV